MHVPYSPVKDLPIRTRFKFIPRVPLCQPLVFTFLRGFDWRGGNLGLLPYIVNCCVQVQYMVDTLMMNLYFLCVNFFVESIEEL